MWEVTLPLALQSFSSVSTPFLPHHRVGYVQPARPLATYLIDQVLQDVLLRDQRLVLGNHDQMRLEHSTVHELRHLGCAKALECIYERIRHLDQT